MKPTKEQVTAEVAALKALKPRVRAMTRFGDDNRAAIQAQIDVLEHDYRESKIYDQFETDERLLDQALEARRWMDGESYDDTPLSEGWKPLAK